MRIRRGRPTSRLRSATVIRSHGASWPGLALPLWAACAAAGLLATPAEAGDPRRVQLAQGDAPAAREGGNANRNAARRGRAATTEAPEDPGRAPLSLDAVQEAARNFHARRDALAAGAASGGGSGDGGRVDEGVASSATPDARPPADTPRGDPPRGASAHPGGREAETVEATPQRRDIGAPKAAPRPPAGVRSATAQSRPPEGAGQRLAFAGGSTTPAAGLDPRLRRAAEAAGERGDTYAFLVMDRAPTGETESALRRLGAEPLGPHGAGALKVKVPLRRQTLEAVSRLPGARALAYATTEQKVAPDLGGAFARLGAEVSRFPIIVNLFDDDRGGAFAARIRSTGAEVGRYDAGLRAYEVLASVEQARAVAGLDFVLFVEAERRGGGGHDQSMPTNGVDYIRAAGFLGAGTVLGILDTGFMAGTAAPIMHDDLNKNGCGRNFTADAAGVWDDQNGHGTHVLATAAGTGTADARFRGVATALGAQERIRAAKIWGANNSGQNAWLRDAIDYMAQNTSCDAPRPAVVNISGGASGTGQTGTDAESRKLDARVWETRQAYVVCSGNSGPNAQTIWSPGVAKNALTVGNVDDAEFQRVGELANGSSRGPTGDRRMKPNLTATGGTVTSARAGTANGYTGLSGCSMATPHVAGVAASLLEHYPDFRGRPHLLRAHLMASSVLHRDTLTPPDNDGGGREDYGLGRVSDYQSHWAHPNRSGWTGHWAWMTVTDRRWGHFDVEVPPGARRLVAVLTWDEPEASAGASQAVTHDIDLWADLNADCAPDAQGQCGEWASQSFDDNTEYLIIDNPPPGRYRLKAINWRAPSSGLPVAIAAKVVRGDPTPTAALSATPSTPSPPVGSTFTVTTTVSNPAYEAYGVHVSVPFVPVGLTLLDAATTREDGVPMVFPNARGLTLGSVVEGDTRSAAWRFRVDAPGPHTMRFRSWSDNGGTAFQSVTVTP